METSLSRPLRYRFGPFEFDAESLELRRDGMAVPLEPQPARALGLLLENAGRTVRREELKARVWEAGTHVDFERGLAYCVSAVRTALGDSAESPQYIQTLPRRGFRFVAPLEPVEDAGAGAAVRSGAGAPSRLRSWLIRAALLIAAAAVIVAWQSRRGTQMAASPPIRLAVAAFDNETGDAAMDTVARGFSDGLVARLAGFPSQRLAVIGSDPLLARARRFRDVAAIHRGLRADYVILGQVQGAGDRMRVIVHLIRAEDESHLWAHRFDREHPDWLELQSEIAERVAAAVDAALLQPQPSQGAAPAGS